MKYIPSYCSTASFPQEPPLLELTESLLNPSVVRQLDHPNPHASWCLQGPLLDLQGVILLCKITLIPSQSYRCEYDYLLYQLCHSFSIEVSLPGLQFPRSCIPF